MQLCPCFLLSWFDSYARDPALRIDELGHERVGWSFAEIGDRAFLNDSAFVHEHDLVCKISRFRQIVSDEKYRLAKPHENFLEIFLQRSAYQRVERAQRLIEQ